MGRVYGYDEWVVSRRVSLGYGLSYAWQDYVGGGGLLSPRVSFTVSPVDRMRLRAVVARTAMAPGHRRVHPGHQGARVDVAAVAALVLRVVEPGGPARADDRSFRDRRRARRRRLRRRLPHVLSARRRSGGRDVRAAVARASRPPRSGHYFVGNLGDVEARGWAVTVSRPIIGSVRGSVDYSQTSARWQNGVASAMTGLFGSGRARRRAHPRPDDVGGDRDRADGDARLRALQAQLRRSRGPSPTRAARGSTRASTSR